MTDAERRLWYFLRRHGTAGRKFRRQHPVGPYIVDFYCADARLVVEVDGGQHFEPDVARVDAYWTQYLEHRGLRVLRFTNLEVLTQTEAVLEVVLRAVEGGSGVGSPSP
jgi:very-short-patch-repair endonuclease